MTDIDSYLLKCALEELDKQFPESADKITQECACRYGYVDSEVSITTNEKENKNDN